MTGMEAADTGERTVGADNTPCGAGGGYAIKRGWVLWEPGGEGLTDGDGLWGDACSSQMTTTASMTIPLDNGWGWVRVACSQLRRS